MEFGEYTENKFQLETIGTIGKITGQSQVMTSNGIFIEIFFRKKAKNLSKNCDNHLRVSLLNLLF